MITMSIDPANESKMKSSPAECWQIVSDFKHAIKSHLHKNISHVT